MSHKIVLVRHGQSQWNKENRFTGWKDVDLTSLGQEEARKAGGLLKAEEFDFDIVYTSVLKRAIRTMWIILSEMDRMWLPVERHWRLNERHYGALAGLNKKETAEKYGDEQVFIWRRSYDTPPPPIDDDSPDHPKLDRRYADVPLSELPLSEALLHCKERVMPCWNNVIAPQVKDGKRVLIVAHGNSLRALVKHIEKISDEDIAEVNIPTGIPLVYELDSELNFQKKHYLGDASAAEAAAAEVANQAK